MKNVLNYAKSTGFDGCALVQTSEIPFDSTLIRFCQENICGRYGVNHACPPHCGSFEKMRGSIVERKHAVVVQSTFDGVNFADKQAVQQAKQMHLDRLQSLREYVRSMSIEPLVVGATGCELCNPCVLVYNKPCAHPDKVFSCTSAYGIDVAQLARVAKLDYQWQDGKLFLYGLIIFD